MPESSFTRLPLLIGLPLLTLLLGWQVGVRYEQEKIRSINENLNELSTGSGDITVDPQGSVDISLLWTVWRLLQKHYVEPSELETQKLLYGAIGGLVQGIGDPYTLFMTPPQNKDFREALQGTLEGIGAELNQKDGYTVIVSPLKGSPAAAAGLMPEDIVLEANGESLQGKSLTEVVTLIRGPKGTQVTLKIAREGEVEPLMFTITRDSIKIPSVESRVITATGAQVGYIALNQFGDTSLNEFKEALEAFDEDAIKGIVLDLRFNGGGYLEGAVELSSLFMKEGKVVSVQGRENKIMETRSVSGNPVLPDLPLVVIINQGSASAAEIAAGALQDNGRAKIVGKTSFGKGTVQEIIDLPGGSSLRVTVAHWLTPKGKNLGKEGVHPDIEVDRTKEDVAADKDPQLDAAIKTLIKN